MYRELFSETVRVINFYIYSGLFTLSIWPLHFISSRSSILLVILIAFIVLVFMGFIFYKMRGRNFTGEGKVLWILGFNFISVFER